MDEKNKKEILENLSGELKMLKQISKPLTDKIDEIERTIFLYMRLKNIGDKIHWTNLWDQREEDDFSGEIVQIDFEKRIYKVKIISFHSSYGGYEGASKYIGEIVEQDI